MHVERVRVLRYSSFDDSGWIPLAAGLNVVVGQNNSGKSALLSAIGPTIPNKPHRNMNRFRQGEVGTSEVHLDVSINADEYFRKLAASGASFTAVVGGPTVNYSEALKRLLQGPGTIHLKSRIAGGSTIIGREPTFSNLVENQNHHMMQVSVANGALQVVPAGGGSDDSLVQALASGEGLSFFNFSAQRLNVGKAGWGFDRRLTSNASNLPVVLAYLQGSETALFDEIVDRVREILPSVDNVTVAPTPIGFEVFVWLTGQPGIRNSFSA